MTENIGAITEKLRDERGKKVIFIAHCILNENTVYQGGAFRKGAVREIVDELQENGIGIVQMTCPEQRAWGGVLKRVLWLELGSKEGLYRFRRIYMPLFIWNTGRIYRKIAKEVAGDIKDYRDSGFDVVGIVGIRGSPSCGVYKTMDLVKSAKFLANANIRDLDRKKFNDQGIRANWTDGSGLFVTALKKELLNRKIEIRFLEHDHFTEIDRVARLGV